MRGEKTFYFTKIVHRCQKCSFNNFCNDDKVLFTKTIFSKTVLSHHIAHWHNSQFVQHLKPQTSLETRDWMFAPPIILKLLDPLQPLNSLSYVLHSKSNPRPNSKNSEKIVRQTKTTYLIRLSSFVIHALLDHVSRSMRSGNFSQSNASRKEFSLPGATQSVENIIPKVASRFCNHVEVFSMI